MNGGTSNRMIIAPEKPPMTPQITIATRQAAVIPSEVAEAPPATSRIRIVERTADRAIRLPTERSIPPVMITMVIPIATMAITAI